VEVSQPHLGSCVVATIADLRQRAIDVEIIGPRDDYANRMLNTMGFSEALATFTDEGGTAVRDVAGRVRRILPILPICSFRLESEVEEIAEDLYGRFQDRQLPISMVQDTATVFAEAASNVIQHAESPVGGFAMVQQRRTQLNGLRTHYIEVAIADPGRGIAASFGRAPEEAERAISDAMDEGMSSTGDRHRGIGLAEVARVIEAGSARGLHVHSDYGEYTISPGIGRHAGGTRNRFPGTVVSAIMAS
jgi:anti-sigma regulatory factor (Ser/Thr protein kinase)